MAFILYMSIYHCVSIRSISVFVRVFGPRANGGQQSHCTNFYSSSGPYGGQILPLVFICLLVMMSTLMPVGAL